MINLVLYKYELKKSWKVFLIFGSIMTMYICMVIGMFDPDMAALFKQLEQTMPEIMAAVGMTGGTDTLIGFMESYLYGMIMLLFPMIYIIIRSNALVAKYVDSGSMATLLTSPIKRTKIILTQLATLYTTVLILVVYSTILEIIMAKAMFPGMLVIRELLTLNFGLLIFQLFIASFCFAASCIFNETKYSLAIGAGIPSIMYIFQMLGNMGGKLENMKYATFFTLFQPNGLIHGQTNSLVYIAILFVGTIALSLIGLFTFKNKDIHL